MMSDNMDEPRDDRNDDPDMFSKDNVAHEWALDQTSRNQTLKFVLVVGDQRIDGNAVPFSALRIGDVSDRLRQTEDHLTRLLGVTVRIEAGE